MANAWGELSWSQGSWGEQNDISVSLTGLQVNCAQNNVSVAIGQQINVTGQQQNLSLNNPFISSTTDIFLSDNPLPNLTIAEGTVDPAPDAEVTGEQLNIFSPGTVTITTEINSGWGRLEWGEFDWGTNTLSAQADATGQQLNITLDNVVATPNTLVDLIGNGLVVEEGIVDPSPDAEVVGQQLPISVNSASIKGDANVSITGIGLEIAQGQAESDAVTFAVTTGQQLEIALNSVVAGASVEVSPTGLELTITTGSINIQAWKIVNTGSDVNWNIIDTAA